MPTVIEMRGPAGSGKSTKAKGMVHSGLSNDRKIVRVNRDDLRAMMLDGEWSYPLEKVIKAAEVSIIKAAAERGYDVVIDDTNLARSTQEMWRQLTTEQKLEHEVKVLDTDFQTCVDRDTLRIGKSHVGRAVIERQFLFNGLHKFSDRKIVLVDVDGTLADHEGIRSPYDEKLVHMDRPYPVVCKWVRNLVHWGDYCINCFKSWRSDDHTPVDPCLCEAPLPAPEYQVFIVSGRHDVCGDSTVRWLTANGVTFEHIFMRAGGDNRPDTIVKKEILDALLKHVPKEQIAFVIDDRPSVIQMWRDNGLRVIPARGAVEPF
jgi:predicted kinase